MGITTTAAMMAKTMAKTNSIEYPPREVMMIPATEAPLFPYGHGLQIG